MTAFFRVAFAPIASSTAMPREGVLKVFLPVGAALAQAGFAQKCF